jgi:acyl-CoA synthetase (AMP-forming)/AMP-acid ligase II
MPARTCGWPARLGVRRLNVNQQEMENVASREVEEQATASRRFPRLLSLPDPRWVEAVTAVIVVKQGQRLTAEAVISHCSRGIATFKVPKDVVFLQALPKNPSGKLLKRELRRQLEGHFNSLERPIGNHESSA